MYLILIAWLYVTLMMAIAEASSPVGSVLGAIVTFVLYGLLPMGIVGYIFGTPARKRRLHAQRLQAQRDWDAAQHSAAAQAENTPETGAPAPSSPAPAVVPGSDIR